MASLREWGFQITKSEVEGVLAGGLCNGFGDVSRRFSVAEDDQVRGPFLCHGFSIPFAYDQKLVFVGNLNFGHAARTAPLAVSASNSAACSFTAPAFLKL